MWLFISFLAYFLAGSAAILDKIILRSGDEKSTSPIAFAFYAGCLSILICVIGPFVGWRIIEGSYIVSALAGGAIFIIALLSYFYAVSRNEISKVVPALSAFVPLSVFFGSYLFLGERLGEVGVLAFLFLVIGGFLATYEHQKGLYKSVVYFFHLVVTGMLFGASAILGKYVFLHTDFWNGFLWIRVGGFAMAILFLVFSASLRREVKKNFQKSQNSISKKSHDFSALLLIVVSQVFGGAGLLLQNYAVSLASVSLVQALESLKYVFVLIFAFILSKAKPHLLSESFHVYAVLQKIIAIVFVSIGVWLLFQ